jgi:hypothetical protein
MISQRHFRGFLIVAAIAALSTTVAVRDTAAQSPVATVEFVPANSNPPVPAGLKVVCLRSSDSGAAPSTTCPVVKYLGITTWAYSYTDNRVSLALVSYDASNKVIANVEKPGARYVFDALSSLHTKTVMFVGQAKQYVTTTWADLGPK